MGIWEEKERERGGRGRVEKANYVRLDALCGLLCAPGFLEALVQALAVVHKGFSVCQEAADVPLQELGRALGHGVQIMQADAFQ